MIARICSQEDKLLKQVDESYLSLIQKEQTKELISERIKTLK